jgi:hypothetical protein
MSGNEEAKKGWDFIKNRDGVDDWIRKTSQSDIGDAIGQLMDSIKRYIDLPPKSDIVRRFFFPPSNSKTPGYYCCHIGNNVQFDAVKEPDNPLSWHHFKLELVASKI